MISLKWACDAKPEIQANSASEAADIAAANDYAPEFLTWSQKLIVTMPEGGSDA